MIEVSPAWVVYRWVINAYKNDNIIEYFAIVESGVVFIIG